MDASPSTNKSWWNDCSGVLNGRIYLFGGYGGGINGSSSGIYTYDTVSNTNQTSSFTLPMGSMYWCGADRVNGKLYLGGGGSGTNGATAYSSIYRFDPTTGFTAMSATLPTSRYQLGATTTADGRLLFVGGAAQGNAGDPLAEVVPYDPAADAPGALSSALTMTGYPHTGVAPQGLTQLDGSTYVEAGSPTTWIRRRS